jgi:hypothetical protein
MTVTEEEANTQQCIGPRNCGRVIGTGSLVPDSHRVCVGSACKMAWRWIDAGTEWSGTYTERDAPAGEGWEVEIRPGDRYGRWVRRKPPTQGYCGLAGKP